MEGTTVALTATVQNGIFEPLAYTWDFGDGTTPVSGTFSGAGSFATSHRYDTPGTYVPRLTIADNDGNVPTRQLTLTVLDGVPSIGSFGTAGTVMEGQSATFAPTVTNPAAEAVSYTWDFGDGTTMTGEFSAVSYTFGLSHTYTTPGTYEISLTTSDDENEIDLIF